MPEPYTYAEYLETKIPIAVNLGLTTNSTLVLFKNDAFLEQFITKSAFIIILQFILSLFDLHFFIMQYTVAGRMGC